MHDFADIYDFLILSKGAEVADPIAPTISTY